MRKLWSFILILFMSILTLTCFTSIDVSAAVDVDYDFETDPGWISIDPDNVYWDVTNGFLNATVRTNDDLPHWAFSPTFEPISNESFVFEFDVKPTDPTWATYPSIALIQEDVPNPMYEFSLRTVVHWSDAYPKKFTLMTELGIKDSVSPVFNTTLWYHESISYDAESQVLTWEIRERDSGTLFHKEVVNNVVINDFNQIAVGCGPLDNGYGGWATIYVDNIKLKTGLGLNDGLVAYYPFNGNANDESGNG
ncbi:MAG: hypothetical protein K8S00_07220, partial [Bacteroidales bacterium]|nr:hypothetical protein [Bacteroidales bacterium]